MSEARVLLIDDDVALARMMVLTLELEGIDVDWCHSRDEGLMKVDGAMPDVVVMDYLMEGMEANEFVGLLRERGFGGPLPLHGFEGDLGIEARTIHKPFDPDDLVAPIREALYSPKPASTFDSVGLTACRT